MPRKRVEQEAPHTVYASSHVLGEGHNRRMLEDLGEKPECVPNKKKFNY